MTNKIYEIWEQDKTIGPALTVAAEWSNALLRLERPEDLEGKAMALASMFYHDDFGYTDVQPGDLTKYEFTIVGDGEDALIGCSLGQGLFRCKLEDMYFNEPGYVADHICPKLAEGSAILIWVFLARLAHHYRELLANGHTDGSNHE